MISTDVAIIAISKSSVKCRGPYNATGDRETEMMAARWNKYVFRHQFSPQEQNDLLPCPRSVAKLVFFE